MNFDLRKEVSQVVSRAIDSSVNYSGKEFDQNRHNWVQITTDRILSSIVQSLPEPVDVRSKYETGNHGGLFVNIDGKDEEKERQLDLLSSYQMDQGWNQYFAIYTDYLRRLYTDPQSVIQSKNENNGNQDFWGTSGRQGEEPNTPPDKEPSQVR